MITPVAFCDDTTLESKAEVAKSVLLQYLYYYESCPAITNVVVDSHMQSLEIQIRSFSKNSTYQQVIVKDPNGNQNQEFLFKV